MNACIIIIRIQSSVVEFQSQLYVPWRLGGRNLAHSGTITHIGCVVLGVVEGVDEVGSELQPESLGDWEVFMQAHVDVGVTGRTQSIELR